MNHKQKISRTILAGQSTTPIVQPAIAAPGQTGPETEQNIFQFLPKNPGASPVEWRTEQGLIAYPRALQIMEERAGQIAAGKAAELIWLVEHPALYTKGTSAQAQDLLTPHRFPVYQSARGGQFTYHGPGQRVVYIMLDLKRRRQDIRALITAIEEWGIHSLAEFGILAERREDRVGIWVAQQANPTLPLLTSEAKIAAIGLRLRKWVSFHGMAVNIAPDLEHYSGIVPCGITEYGITSMAELGKNISFAEWDKILKQKFQMIFGVVK